MEEKFLKTYTVVSFKIFYKNRSNFCMNSSAMVKMGVSNVLSTEDECNIAKNGLDGEKFRIFLELFRITFSNSFRRFMLFRIEF